MNIFLRELKANFKSLIIWSVISILFTIVGFAKFSAYYGNPQLLVILNDIPPALLDALNLSAFNLTTITGFLGVMFTYFALIVSIAGAMWGSDIISKEERDKTVEFALTLPVTRSKLITGKTLAAVVNCILLLVVTWVSMILSAQQYQPDSEFYTFLAWLMVALLVMELTFLSIGIFLGSAMKRYRQAGSVAVSLLLATYILSIISQLNKNLEFLKYFSPFTYFNPAAILRDSTIDFKYVLLSAGIVLVCLVGAYIAYSKRDLYI